MTIKQFIQKLQNSPERIRRRWLVILSGGSMFIIIILWVIYINIIVKPAGLETEVKAAPPRPSFVRVLTTGFKVTGAQIQETIGGAITSLRNKLNKKNTIKIQGSERNFILDTLEPIPPTELP